MKAIKTTALAIVIFFSGQWLIVTILDSLLLKSNFRYSALYSESTLDYDVLCYGNSRATHSFYTPYLNSEYDLNAFNFSYNSLKIGVIKILIEDYLDKYNAPEKIYLELSDVFSPLSESQFSKFSIYSSFSPRLAEAIKNEDINYYYTYKVFPLYKYNSEFLYRSLYYLGKSDQTWVNRYNISKELNDETLLTEPAEFIINDFKLSQLKEILTILEKKDIEAILYMAPYLPNFKDKIVGLDQGLARIEKETGKSIIDLSGAISKVEFFSDRIHSNEKGTQDIGDLLFREDKNINSTLYIH